MVGWRFTRFGEFPTWAFSISAGNKLDSAATWNIESKWGVKLVEGFVVLVGQSIWETPSFHLWFKVLVEVGFLRCHYVCLVSDGIFPKGSFFAVWLRPLVFIDKILRSMEVHMREM